MITGPVYPLKIFMGYEKAFALAFNSHPRSYNCHSHTFKLRSRPHLGLRVRVSGGSPLPVPWVLAGLSCVSSGRRILGASPVWQGASSPHAQSRAIKLYPLPGGQSGSLAVMSPGKFYTSWNSTLLDGIGLLSAFSHQSVDIKKFYFFPISTFIPALSNSHFLSLNIILGRFQTI